MTHYARVHVRSLALVVILAFLPVGAIGGPASIKSDDLKQWLSFIASDDTQGRAVFSAGLGLAAAYISDHLRVWGVKPGGDHSSYLQTVRVLGVKSTSRSTVTVRIGNDSRTFADNDAVECSHSYFQFLNLGSKIFQRPR